MWRKLNRLDTIASQSLALNTVDRCDSPLGIAIALSVGSMYPIAGVNFRPQSPGEWQFAVSFVTGSGAAIAASSATVGTSPVPGVHGLSGSFWVVPTDKHGADLRSKGMLRYVGTRYLQHDNGEHYVKAGTDSPENVTKARAKTLTVNLVPIHPIHPNPTTWGVSRVL